MGRSARAWAPSWPEVASDPGFHCDLCERWMSGWQATGPDGVGRRICRMCLCDFGPTLTDVPAGAERTTLRQLAAVTAALSWRAAHARR